MFDDNPFRPNVELPFGSENASWIMDRYGEVVGARAICQRCRRNQTQLLHECGGSFCWECLHYYWAERRRERRPGTVCPECQKMIGMKVSR